MRHRVPVLLFFLSGATALAYEVLWMVHLGRLFGTTAEAAAATLTAFFLGLGLGGFAFGRVAGRLRRPLLAFGVLEILIGLLAGLGLLATEAHGALYTLLADPVGTPGLGLTAARLGLSVLLVGPAAFLMGGTLPVLGEHVVRRRQDLGRGGSLLYAANTLGAGLGCLAATFLLSPALGYRGTYVAALAASALVGLAAVALGTRRDAARQRATAPAPPAVDARGPAAWGASPGALAFASGALALALQVLWVRMFAQALPGSLYVFGTVLVVFLGALGLGGALAHVLARSRLPPRAVLAHLLAAAAVLVAVSGPVFLARTGGLRPPDPAIGWTRYVTDVVLHALLALGPAVLVLGGVFPYLFRAVEARSRGAGRSLGHLLLWNTLGAAVGASGAGFLLLPLWGLWGSLRLLAFAYAALALVVVWRRLPLHQRAVPVAALLLVVAPLLPTGPVVRLAGGERCLEAWEGASATVAVLERDGHRKIVVDNVFALGGTREARWEALQAHVPLCLHPSPRRVFFLGLGTGITAGAALDHPVERVVAAELLDEVIDAARGYFAPHANGLFEDDRARVVRDDGRHLLRWTDETYDVIVGDLFFPWEAGTESLYTREHFTAVRARLAEGGLFAQWLPGYQLSPDEVRSIARTFVDVFPQALLWRGDFFADRPLLALVGYARPTTLDAPGLVARAGRLPPGDAEALARGGPALPLHLYAGNLTVARRLLEDAPLLTDDRPRLAYSAPRSERQRRDVPSPGLLVGEALLAFERALREACPPAEDPYLTSLDARGQRYVRAGLVLREMAVALAAHDRDAHARALLDYVRLVPARDRPDLERWIE